MLEKFCLFSIASQDRTKTKIKGWNFKEADFKFNTRKDN